MPLLLITNRNQNGFFQLIDIITASVCVCVCDQFNMFKNLVVLISGGASRLGQATAHRLANKGAEIVLTDLPQTNGASIAKQIGENVHFLAADATSGPDVETLVNEINKKFGKLNVLVNCIGLGNIEKDIHTDDLDFFENQLKTQLIGSFNMIRLTVGLIGDNEPDEHLLRGVIINTAGLDGIHRAKDRSAIAATHGPLLGLTKCTASDLAVRGIRVNTIIPTLSETSSAEIQNFLKENNLIVASKLNNNPDGFAHVVQTIIANPYMNTATIDLSGGVSRFL